MRASMWLPLASWLALAPAALAQGACPAPTGAEPTAQPEVRRGHDQRFRQRLEQISRALEGGRHDVLMLGDSLIQQWQQAEAERAFPGLRVLNAGMPGYSAANLLGRLLGQPSEAIIEGRRVRLGITGWERQDPAFVLLLVGNAEVTREQDPCAVAAGVAAVLRQLGAMYPRARLLVASLLPRGARLELMPERIAEVNARLREAAERVPNARFIDLHAALRCEAAGPCELTRPPNYGHLSSEGYARVSAALAAAVAQLPVRGGSR